MTETLETQEVAHLLMNSTKEQETDTIASQTKAMFRRIESFRLRTETFITESVKSTNITHWSKSKRAQSAPPPPQGCLGQI